MAVGVEGLLALGDVELAAGEGGVGELREAVEEVSGVVLHVLQHLGDGIALDLVVEVEVAVAEGDGDDVGVAEEVVEVAEGLLVGADEEGTEVVLLIGGAVVEVEVVVLLVQS